MQKGTNCEILNPNNRRLGRLNLHVTTKKSLVRMRKSYNMSDEGTLRHFDQAVIVLSLLNSIILVHERWRGHQISKLMTKVCFFCFCFFLVGLHFVLFPSTFNTVIDYILLKYLPTHDFESLTLKNYFCFKKYLTALIARPN